MNKIAKIIVLAIIPMLMALGGSISNRVKKGNESFEQKKYDEALQYYKNAQVDEPESPELHYNIGSTLYKMRKYEDSLSELNKVMNPDEPLLEEKANYNMGVVQYRSGIQEYNKKNYQGAIDWLGKSIDSNIAALKLDPNDEDAKFNLEQARRKLKEINAELSKMQQQQENQKNQQQQGENKESQGEQKNEQSNKTEQQQAAQEKNQQEKKSEEQKQEKGTQEEKQQVAKAQESQGEKKSGGENKEVQMQEMSKEDAERLLQMLSEDEEKKPIYENQSKSGDIYIEKDW